MINLRAIRLFFCRHNLWHGKRSIAYGYAANYRTWVTVTRTKCCGKISCSFDPTFGTPRRDYDISKQRMNVIDGYTVDFDMNRDPPLRVLHPIEPH